MNNNELYHWKYVTKKKVNGKWRYYYDETGKGKIKKGFSVADKLEKHKLDTMSTLFGDKPRAPRTEARTHIIDAENRPDYYLSRKGGESEKVSKGAYDHFDNAGSGGMLLYDGEPVRDIMKRKSKVAKRTVSDVKKNCSKQINKAKKWIKSLF